METASRPLRPAAEITAGPVGRGTEVMTLHKLNPAPATEQPKPLVASLGISQQEYSLAHSIVKARAAQASRVAMSSFPIYRYVRCAVRGKVEEVFDDFALQSGLVPQRLFMGDLILEGAGVFVNLDGCEKAGYCSCSIEICAESLARAQEVRQTLLGAGAEDHFYHEPAERGGPR